MSATVLLTGATGFVGYQVLRELLARRLSVRVVLREGSEKKLGDCISEVEVVGTNDLFAESVDWWTNACREIETVIHVAWYAEPGEYLQSPRNIDCLTGSLQLARGAVNAGVRRFVGIGTCFEYDLSAGKLSVDTPLKPLTSYAAAKAALFTALAQCLPAQQIEFLWCRLFYLYGEREDPRRLAPYLKAQLQAGEPVELTSGNQVRDYLDVATAGEMIVERALSAQEGAVNICSGLPITIRQFAEEIADEYGRRDLLIFGARPDNLVDPPCVVGLK